LKILNKYLRKIFFENWPFWLLLFLVGSFLWKFIFKGLIPIPADITVGMYFPWLDYKWGFEVGVPVKNHMLSDVVSVIYPIKVLIMEFWKEGFVPLWNPYMFGGYPLLANIQMAPFNLTNLLYLFLSNSLAWGIHVSLQLLISSFFTYLFLRYLKLGKLASILGAMIYAFSGFSLIWWEWDAHSCTVAFLPLILFFTGKYFDKGKLIDGLLLSLALAWQIFSGYPQALLYEFFVLAIFVLLTKKLILKRAIFWLFFLAMGVGLASVQLLPTAELMSISQRKVEALDSESAFLSWQNLIAFFAPDYFGNDATQNFWGKGSYTNNVAYSGVVAIILAGIAFMEIKKKGKETIFFVLILIFSLMFAFSTPLSRFIKNLNFLGLNAASGTRSLFLCNFAFAGLASLGFDALTKKREAKHIRALYLPLIVTTALFLGTFLSYNTVKSVNLDSPAGQAFLDTVTKNLKTGFRNLILPLGLVFGFGVFLVLAKGKTKLLKTLSLVGIFLITVFELFRFGWKYTPFSRPDLIFPSTPVIEFLKNQPGIFRVDGGDAIPMNMLLPYKIESLSGYDAVYPLKVSKYIAAINSGNTKKPQGRYGKIDNYQSRLIDISNVCYLLAVKRDKIEKADPGGRVGWTFRKENLAPVFEDRSVQVLQNLNCLPRAFLVGDYEVITEEQQIIDRLNSQDFNYREKIIIEKEPEMIIGGKNTNINGSVEWRVNRSGKEVLFVKTSFPSLLFVSNTYYPGWKAFIDGKETEILRADFVFRAVVVPEGTHKVSFIYAPQSFKIGVSISLLILLFLLLLVIYKFIIKFLKNAESSR